MSGLLLIPSRKSEVKLVTEYLEGPATDVEALAKAVITALDEDRIRREQYVIRMSLGGLYYGMGPFITETQALNAARMMRPDTEDDDVLMRSVARLMPPTLLTTKEPETLAGTCPDCGHPKIAHDWPKAKVSGCVVGYRATATGDTRSKKLSPEEARATGCQCGRRLAA